MAIEIVQRPAFTAVGMSIRTMPRPPEIPALWPKFVARLPEIQGQIEPKVTYGVMQHEPPGVLSRAAGHGHPRGTGGQLRAISVPGDSDPVT